MRLIQINPNNATYYSKDFVKGFECGTKRQLEADERSIIRCGDCKWFSVIEDYFMCGVWSNVTNEEEFCSYGERRKDD